MRILIIGYVWPEPNSSAAGHRMMQLIQCLQLQNFSITFSTPAQATGHQVDLQALGIDVQPIELNSNSFDHFIQTMEPDIVIFDRFMMEEQFGWRVEKYCPAALRVLNTEDLHSLRQARHKSVKVNKPFQLEDMNSDLGVREVASILRSDLTLMISHHEYQLLSEHFSVPEYQILHLPFMIPPVSEEQKHSLPNFEERINFVSIGNFRHEPNWDMVLQLKQHIWPVIRKHIPNAELHVYGSYPPPKATQLHNAKQGFHLKGWAENAEEVMNKARICLAPIRFGAGIKGKLVDAMKAGTTSITTSMGAESMHDDFSWNGVITDNFSDFAQAAIRLYNDKEEWLRHQKVGFSILEQKYSETYWRTVFVERLMEAKQHQNEYRQKNFMGLMVRHHSLKSTQYMSQWIEAKNSH